MSERGRIDTVVQRIDAEPISAVVVRGTVTRGELPAFVAHAAQRVADRAAEWGCPLRGRPLARLLRDGDLLEVQAGYQVAAAWHGCCVDDDGDLQSVVFGGHPVVSVLHVGRHDEIGTAYDAALDWMDDLGLVPAGASWEVYLDGPESALRRTAIHLPFESIPLPRQRGRTAADGPARG